MAKVFCLIVLLTVIIQTVTVNADECTDKAHGAPCGDNSAVKRCVCSNEEVVADTSGQGSPCDDGEPFQCKVVECYDDAGKSSEPEMNGENVVPCDANADCASNYKCTHYGQYSSSGYCCRSPTQTTEQPDRK